MIPYIDFEPTEVQIAREAKRLAVSKIAMYILEHGEEPTDITPFQTLTEEEQENLKRVLWAMQKENEPNVPVQPNDEIWYTSTDANPIELSDEKGFGEAILEFNTYSDGKGILKFDKDLTTIGDEEHMPFVEIEKLSTISLPEGVTRIGNCAFIGCTNLALTSLPEGVTSIEISAFGGCWKKLCKLTPSGG